MCLLPITGNFASKVNFLNKQTTVAEEQKYVALRNALKEDIDSVVAINIEPKQHLELLKKNRSGNV